MRASAWMVYDYTDIIHVIKQTCPYGAASSQHATISFLDISMEIHGHGFNLIKILNMQLYFHLPKREYSL